VFNTGQGVQFTAGARTGRPAAAGLVVRMDGRADAWTTCPSSGRGGR
jgi:hypothetical protein